MLDYYLVDVKSITSDVPRSNFEEAELDQLADLILEAGGLIKPLSLRQTGPESYEVIEGHREYFASVRAKEKNPRKGEMINAFVLNSEEEAPVIEQSEVLLPPIPPPPPPSGSTTVEPRLTNLETRLDQAIQDLKTTQRNETQRLEDEIKALQSRLPQPLEPLTAFNTLDEIGLVKILNRAGIKGKRADGISSKILATRKKKPFSDFTDIVSRISGLSDKGMITILDSMMDTH